MGMDYREGSDTGNWNVNMEYSRYEIMRHIAEASILEEIANFGTATINDEFLVLHEDKQRNRLVALKRFRKKLEIIIRRTKFAIQNKDKPIFIHYLNVLRKLKDYIPKTEKRISTLKGTRTEVNEKMFIYILERLESMFADMLEPLNRADMIFSGSDEIEPDELKDILKNRLSTQP